MLAAGVATYRFWREQGGALPQVMAGHSLGEIHGAGGRPAASNSGPRWSWCRFRAQAMQAAVPQGQGAMAAILGLEDSDVEAVCAEAGQGEVVEAVNFNAPGQVVIAGHVGAVERAIDAGDGARCQACLPLPISVPAHSSLMLPAAARLAERLAATPVAAPAGSRCTASTSSGTQVPMRSAPGWSSSCIRRCTGPRRCARMIAAGRPTSSNADPARC